MISDNHNSHYNTLIGEFIFATYFKFLIK
ncbi:hypothetical protein RIR_e648_jg15110.t1 [Rhizophagus irregularis DAOM 181602=DAOM 197198]|nr:hypothetical protein RIR_e648_jg15110.t1 [Rhizophagus irregularis DAOM 181602=DAOM 197198]